MRKIEIGTENYTQVFATDEKEFNANHEYEVRQTPSKGATISENEIYAKVKFQKGPIKEYGINGCHNEDLIAIVIDTLQSYQTSEYNCRENAIAITKLEEALMWLNKRTQCRQKRGVKSTSKV